MTQEEFFELGYIVPRWLEGGELVKNDEKIFIEKNEVIFDAEQFVIENVRLYEARKYKNAN